MEEQVSFKFRTFQLPLPCDQPAGNGYWRSECSRHKIIVRGLRHRWIPSPDRKEIKCHTNDEQGDRKMNDYRVLRVFCQQGCFYVKRVHVVLSKTLRGCSSRQLCAIRLSVPFSPRSKSRIVRWSPLMITSLVVTLAGADSFVSASIAARTTKKRQRNEHDDCQSACIQMPQKRNEYGHAPGNG